MITTKKYRKKTDSETVQAIQITEENIRDVAKWCYSYVFSYHPGALSKSDSPRSGLSCIEVTTSRYQGKARTTRAYAGDWVAMIDGHTINLFRVYREESFPKLFEDVDEEAEKREAIMKIVDQALTASGPDHDAMVCLFTSKIMDVFETGKK